MTYKNLTKWNTKVSLVYAIGIWTVIGSYGYLKATGRLGDVPVKKEEEENQPKDPSRVVHKSGSLTTTVIYKKDFVPYTTRIYNFISQFWIEPGTEDKKK